MGNREKGKRFEDRIKKYLESCGWTVDKARAAVRFVGPGRAVSSPNDFFGCADLIGVHQDKPYTLMIQCHAGKSATQRKAKLEAINWHYTAQRVQLWMPQSGMRGGIRALSLCMPGRDWSEYFFRLKAGNPVEDLL